MKIQKNKNNNAQHSFLLLLSTLTTVANTSVSYTQNKNNNQAHAHVTSTITPRSQTTNGARALAYFQNRINDELNINHAYEQNKSRFAFHITPGATRSFWPEHINQCLFAQQCPDDRVTFSVAGSHVKNRDTTEWLADYFGLPTDFESNIITRPRVKNFVMDTNAYINCDAITPGLYLTLAMPIVHTNWSMKLTETVQNTGSNNYDAGYFSPNIVDRSDLLDCMSEFITGENTPTIADITYQPLEYAKISRCSLKKSGIAEIQTTVGYQIYATDTYGLDCFALVNIPGGNKPEGEFLFEPIIGNGHHWEVGVGLAGFIAPWFGDDPTKKAALYAHAHINHLFADTQIRTFDLCGKPLSRYMLASNFRPATSTDTLSGTPQHRTNKADYIFNTTYAPVANLTTIPVSVGTAWQTELTLMFEYAHNNWSWIAGYNFWARSKENIHRCGKTKLDTQLWGLKGDAHMFGFAGDNATALSATQNNNATIYAGKNFGTRGVKTESQIDNGRRNPAIDNPSPATITDGAPTILTATPGGSIATDQINTSIQPIILTSCDIDLNSACSKGLSHTVFAQFQRTWHSQEPLIPFFGVGAQVEFGPTGSYLPSTPTDKCINCALANWGVWIKTGFSYQ